MPKLPPKNRESTPPSDEEIQWIMDRESQFAAVIPLTQESRVKLVPHFAQFVFRTRRLSARKRSQHLEAFVRLFDRFLDLVRNLSTWEESHNRILSDAEKEIAVISEVAKFIESLDIHTGLPDSLRAETAKLLTKIQSDSKQLIGGDNEHSADQLRGAAFDLIANYVRALERLFNPAFAIAEKAQEVRRKGAVVTNEDHSRLRPNYQEKVEAHMRTGLAYHPATEMVAQEEGVNGRTVRNNTKNPSPRNRGGKRRK